MNCTFTYMLHCLMKTVVAIYKSINLSPVSIRKSLHCYLNETNFAGGLALSANLFISFFFTGEFPWTRRNVDNKIDKKIQLKFYLRISRYSKVIYFVYQRKFQFSRLCFKNSHSQLFHLPSSSRTVCYRTIQ